jgi:histone-lysine N-methyltransferase SETMAR
VFDHLSRRKKVVIWVSFSRSGIGNIVLLSPKETINRVFLIQEVLADFDKELWRARPMKRCRTILFHLDNPTPHRASQDFDRLGIARLSHPPYSQDLAPCDFWLFGALKRKLEGFTFEDQIAVLLAINIIFSTIPREEFISVFDE